MIATARIDSLVAVADVVRELDDFRSLEETLDRICQRAAGLGGYDGASLFMADEDARALVIRGSWRVSEEYVGHINRARLLALEDAERPAVPPTVESFLTGNSIAISDVREDPSFHWKAEALLGGYRALVCTPVIMRAQVIGVLNCYGSVARKQTRDEVELLDVVARLAGVAIETARVADLRRAAQNELVKTTARQDERNRELARLATLQSRLAEDAALPPSIAVDRAVLTLAEALRRTVMVTNRAGAIVAFRGQADSKTLLNDTSTRRGLLRLLAQRTRVDSRDVSCVRIGPADGIVGILSLHPSLSNDLDFDELAVRHTAAMVAVALREPASTSEGRRRPIESATLLALVHGLYGRLQVADVIRAHRDSVPGALRVAVLTCATYESAYRLSRRLERFADAGLPVLAAVADGVDCLTLLDGAVEGETLRLGIRGLRERHVEIVAAGLSAPAELRSLANSRHEAIAAANLQQSDDPDAVLFDDLGIYGELVRRLSPEAIQAVLDEALRQLSLDDHLGKAGETGDVLEEIKRRLSAGPDDAAALAELLFLVTLARSATHAHRDSLAGRKSDAPQNPSLA